MSDFEAIARRFAELPPGVPGHFTKAEVERGMAIAVAESMRSQAQLAVVAVIKEAFRQHPDAATAGEAVQRAGLGDEFERREGAVTEPDEVGLRWLVRETERAIAAGNFIHVPVP